jgi:hypothetical protein
MKYRYSSLIFVLVLLLSITLAVAQAGAFKADDNSLQLPFGQTEELVYEGEFSRSLLRSINIAELRFRATRTSDNRSARTGNQDEPVKLQFTAEATSKGIFSKLFKLNFRQRIESTVEPSSFTVLRTVKLDVQGKRLRESEAVFDAKAGRVVWTEKDPNDPSRTPRVVTNETKGTIQDIASVFYFLRTQELEPGKSFELTVSDSGQIYSLPVKVVERKKMKTMLGEVSTVRVDPELFGEGRLIRGEGKISIWFTDDARHIPVRARISNNMGTVEIKLKSLSGGGQTKKS